MRQVFTSSHEVSLFLLSQLDILSEKYKDAAELAASIDNFKQQVIAYEEDHQADMGALANRLKQLNIEFGALGSPLVLKDSFLLRKLHDALEGFEDSRDLKDRWRAPLHRRIESQLPCHLLMNPTPAMQAAAQQVSDGIIVVLQAAKVKSALPEKIREFIARVNQGSIQLYAGRLDNRREFNIDDIIDALKPESTACLVSILYLHFLFSLHVMRSVPLSALADKPVPVELVALVEKHGKSLERFRAQLDAGDHRTLSWLSDVALIRHKLYGGPHDEPGATTKGRGALTSHVTNQLGLLCVEDKSSLFAAGLPTLPLKWSPDAIRQLPNWSSSVVIDSLGRNDLYVSGTSGMCSLFLSMMLMVGRLSREQQTPYIAVIVAYIVGTGQHSQDEVLRLVRRNFPCYFDEGGRPGEKYEVRTPRGGSSIRPAKLTTFWRQLARFDPDFDDCHAAAWLQLSTLYRLHWQSSEVIMHFELTAPTIALLSAWKALVLPTLSDDIDDDQLACLIEKVIVCNYFSGQQLLGDFLESDHDRRSRISARPNIQQLLHRIVFDGNNIGLLFLLDRIQVDINAVNDEGYTVLFIAVQQGHVDVLKLLLAREGIDVNALTAEGATALFIAAQEGYIDVVESLPFNEIPLCKTVGELVSFASRRERSIQERMALHVGDAEEDEVVTVTPCEIAAIMGHSDIVALLGRKSEASMAESGAGMAVSGAGMVAPGRV
ncbi:MAG: ankyrin repeat domain-containing protein [Coxiellaceae bacterium]|nr:ankyrin repeat domain-containing protein [Coxiellaceae bacterium]